MLIKTDKTQFIDFLEDSSGMPIGNAEKVIFPETEKEVVSFFQEASSDKLPITISGAGTGVVGARVPYGGAVVSTDKLKKIIDIYKTGEGRGVAIVEPGVSISELNLEAAKFNLTYAPDSTEKNAYIGGTVATNASGAQGFKYGATRQHIKGLRLVLLPGHCIDIQRGQTKLDGKIFLETKSREIKCNTPTYLLPRTKSAAGYYAGKNTDLIDLFIGQEGTLALVSRIEVFLNPLPESCLSGLIFFDTEESALECIISLKKQSYSSRQENESKSIDAACIEYFDKNSLDILREKYSRIPDKKAAAVYFEQNIKLEDEMQIMELYASELERAGININSIWFADTDKTRKLLADIRYDLPVFVNEIRAANGVSKISTDCAVSDERFPVLFSFYKNKLKSSNIPYCMFGHIGENHLHVNLMPTNKKDFLRAKDIYLEFMKETVRLKGTIAAEHGIGKLKREYLKIMMGKKGLEEMLDLKRAFDPEFLLGRGNILEYK